MTICIWVSFFGLREISHGIHIIHLAYNMHRFTISMATFDINIKIQVIIDQNTKVPSVL